MPQDTAVVVLFNAPCVYIIVFCSYLIAFRDHLRNDACPQSYSDRPLSRGMADEPVASHEH